MSEPVQDSQGWLFIYHDVRLEHMDELDTLVHEQVRSDVGDADYSWRGSWEAGTYVGMLRVFDGWDDVVETGTTPFAFTVGGVKCRPSSCWFAYECCLDYETQPDPDDDFEPVCTSSDESDSYNDE